VKDLSRFTTGSPGVGNRGNTKRHYKSKLVTGASAVNCMGGMSRRETDEPHILLTCFQWVS